MTDLSAATKIYCGNLPDGCTPGQLRDVFGSYGEMIELSVIKNYAFIHFAKKEDAERAATDLNKTKLSGNTLSVELSNNQASSRRGGADASSGRRDDRRDDRDRRRDRSRSRERSSRRDRSDHRDRSDRDRRDDRRRVEDTTADAGMSGLLPMPGVGGAPNPLGALATANPFGAFANANPLGALGVNPLGALANPALLGAIPGAIPGAMGGFPGAPPMVSHSFPPPIQDTSVVASIAAPPAIINPASSATDPGVYVRREAVHSSEVPGTGAKGLAAGFVIFERYYVDPEHPVLKGLNIAQLPTIDEKKSGDTRVDKGRDEKRDERRDERRDEKRDQGRDRGRDQDYGRGDNKRIEDTPVVQDPYAMPQSEAPAKVRKSRFDSAPSQPPQQSYTVSTHDPYAVPSRGVDTYANSTQDSYAASGGRGGEQNQHASRDNYGSRPVQDSYAATPRGTDTSAASAYTSPAKPPKESHEQYMAKFQGVTNGNMKPSSAGSNNQMGGGNQQMGGGFNGTAGNLAVGNNYSGTALTSGGPGFGQQGGYGGQQMSNNSNGAQGGYGQHGNLSSSQQYGGRDGNQRGGGGYNMQPRY